MNILIQTRETNTDKEIKELVEHNKNHVFISHSTDESIDLLSTKFFDKAVISMKNINDAAILKFLNDYYPSTQVVVIANKAFDDIISTFQKGNYSVIHEPLKISELEHKLVKGLNLT
jgi:DNA-binding NtrC family response regulator